jgi:hypothetical protein
VGADGFQRNVSINNYLIHYSFDVYSNLNIHRDAASSIPKARRLFVKDLVAEAFGIR